MLPRKKNSTIQTRMKRRHRTLKNVKWKNAATTLHSPLLAVGGGDLRHEKIM
jgi:hypothetical protein